MGYAPLEAEDEVMQLNSRPRWVTCIAFFATVILVAAAAVSVGLITGYTYCYFEYQSRVKLGNVAKANIMHVMELPQFPNKGNKTIKSALGSSAFISRILNLGKALIRDDTRFFPWLVKNWIFISKDGKAKVATKGPNDDV